MQGKTRVPTLKARAVCHSPYEIKTCYIPLQTDYGGLGCRFFQRLGENADKIQQVDTVNNMTETKGSVRSRAIKLALDMKERGVNADDIILIYSRTHADQTVVVLATLFLGAIVAPMCPDTPYKECLELLQKLEPKMCFCDTRMISQINRATATLNVSSIIVTFGEDDEGATPFSKLFNKEEDENFVPVQIQDVKKSIAFIIPTQGSCDIPKLVCLSHHNLFVDIINFLKIFNNPQKIVSFFPLSWVMQSILVCACFDTETVRIIAGPFSERNACKLIQDFQIDNAILGSELAMRLVTNVALRDFNVTSLKNVMVGNLPTTKFDLVHLRMVLPHVQFLKAYTLSETGCVATTSHFDYETAVKKPGSVGKILSNGRVRIIDMDTHEVLTADKVGELYFSGEGVMLRYFKDPDKTSAAFDDYGFFKTGDLAKFDDEGWIYILGRIEDLISLETNKRFCPTELQDIILGHPLVYEVVVIGDKNSLIACVIKKPDAQLTEDKLMTYIKERVPDQIKLTNIIFYEDLPRTTTGNIKKYMLRNELIKVTVTRTFSNASIS